jgi:hypothetical protein
MKEILWTLVPEVKRKGLDLLVLNAAHCIGDGNVTTVCAYRHPVLALKLP